MKKQSGCLTGWNNSAALLLRGASRGDTSGQADYEYEWMNEWVSDTWVSHEWHFFSEFDKQYLNKEKHLICNMYIIQKEAIWFWFTAFSESLPGGEYKRKAE